jgi:hypothetical protein
MKIKIKGKVFLQKYDIVFIVHELDTIPAAIIDIIFSDGNVFMTHSQEDGKCFAYSFEGEAADWLMNQGWIVDFGAYKSAEVREINKLIKQGRRQHKADIKAFNSSDEGYRREHFDEKYEEFRKEMHRLASLDLMRAYLKGRQAIELPSG